MTITQMTLLGSAASSNSTTFTSLANAVTLRTSPRLWTQARIAEQLAGSNVSSSTSDLYDAIAQRTGIDYFSHSSFDSGSEDAFTLWPMLSVTGADFRTAVRTQLQAVADQAKAAVKVLDEGDSSEVPMVLRKAAAEMYQRMKTISIISDLTGGTHSRPRSYHGRSFSA